MFTSVSADTPGGQVRRITFVPFLPDGRCVLIDGARLPEGDVLAGEDYRLDTVLCVPLETAGFRYQRFQPCNAIDWMPPGDLRFDYVHVLLDCVPGSRRADLIRHHLAHTVRPAAGQPLCQRPGRRQPACPRCRPRARLPGRRSDLRRHRPRPPPDPDRDRDVPRLGRVSRRFSYQSVTGLAYISWSSRLRRSSIALARAVICSALCLAVGP
jgi:hypothetical protein